jgi:hypothetical protein
VIAKRILLDHPRVRIMRGADGKLNSADLFAPTQEGGSALPLLGGEITIADGEIVFEDAFQTETVRALTLRRVTTSLKAGTRELGFRFFAAVPHEKGEATFTANGQIVRAAGTEPAGKAAGRIEAKAINLGLFTPYLRAGDIPGLLGGLADLDGAFEYRWAQADRALTLKELTVKTGGAVLTGRGVLEGLFSPRMRFAASAASTPFRVESLVQSFPEEVLRAHSLGFLRDGQVTGSIRFVSVQVRGAPDRAPRISVQGEVELMGGTAIVGEHQVPLSDVKGLLMVNGDRVVIERLTGRYGLADVTEGHGEITNLTENPRLRLDIKGKVSAPELAVIVARFAPKEVLPGGPHGLSGLHGEADAAVRLAGSLARLDDLDVDWSLEANGVGFADARLNLPVSGVQGRVRSVRRGVAFENLSGLVGKSTLALDGEIAIQKDEKTHYALRLSGQADATEVWKAAADGSGKELVVDGTTGFGFSLSGRTGAIRGTGRLDLRQTGLAHDVGLGKPKGVPGSLEFDLLVDPGRSLQLDRVLLEVSPLKGHIKGKIALQQPRNFALDVRIPLVALRSLPKGVLVMKTPPDGGSFQADFSMTGLLDTWRAAKLRGRAGVKQAAFKVEGLPAPVEDLNIEMAFEDDRIELEHGTVKLQDSRINAKGAIRGWRGVPLVQLAFDSPGLDLELLIPEGERTAARAAMEGLSRNTKLSTTAAISNGIYRGIQFDTIQAKVSGGDGVLVLDPIAGRSGGGAIVGQARIALQKGKPAAVESSLHVKGVSVEPLIRAFGIKEPPFTGALFLDGAVRGDGGDPRGTSSTLNGDIRVLIKDGNFAKLSATSKIIGILNLPTLLAGKVDFSAKGMPFDCISGRVIIKNGMAEVKDYLVDSPIMKITGAGTYDIPNDRYDMVMAVSPFGSYEEFLKSIPLFGKLFVGEREGLVTAFFEVKGPMSDPTVTSLPMKSVASGVVGLAQLAFDVMKNAILLPKELISPTKKAVSPCSAP